MSSSCEKIHTNNFVCHPYITLACIISCAISTIVMIWGVYAMRGDMARMETMMISSNSISKQPLPMNADMTMSSEMMSPSSNNNDAIREHCQTMPEMVGCEEYR